MAAIIGLMTVELRVPGCRSLKDKRQVIQSIVTRVRQSFNVSVAQVDHLDSWQLATLAVVSVSLDTRYIQGQLQRIIDLIDSGRFGIVLIDYETELL